MGLMTFAMAGFAVWCMVGSISAAARSPSVHHYEVKLSADREQLTVRARLANRVRTLRARHAERAEALVQAQDCDGQALKQDGRNIALPAGVTCVQYRYNLAEAYPEGGGSRWVRYADANRVTRPSDWLFRPRLSDSSEIQLTFSLPDQVQVSAPWTPADGPDSDPAGRPVFRVGPSPNSSDALVVFGGFDYRELPVPGATLRVALLQSADAAADPEVVSEWLQQSAAGVALAHGQFPNPLPQVLVVPVESRSSSAVPFGRVIRDAGESIQFFIKPDLSADDYLNDWTATHEFSHLLLPYVRDRWVSEGFASYYQNVLMARSGRYTQTQGWELLHAGIERARAVSPRVSPIDTSRGSSRPRMMVYWSGAALALLGDVQQRIKSNGEESLEIVLGRLMKCCLPSSRSWQARGFFEKLDELSEYPVWMALYRQHAQTPGVPDLSDLYAELGVVIDADGAITLDNSARYWRLRQALMGPASSSRLTSQVGGMK